MIQRFLSLLCCSILYTAVYAGGTETLLQGRDSSYIGVVERPWSFRLYGVTKVLELNLRSVEDSIPSARYNPREKLGIGVGTFYRSFGLWAGMQLGNKPNERQAFRLDLQLNQFGKKFTNDYYFQFYRGLFLENQDVFQRFIQTSTNNYREDISVVGFGMNSYYYFNWKRFSMRAVYIQSEQQKKAAGSLLAGGSLSNFAFQADSSVLPLNQTDFAGEGIRAGNSLLLAGNIGYTYSWVWNEHAYANVTVISGAGISSWSYSIIDGPDNQVIRPLWRIAGRASIGYNSKRFFYGINAIMDQSTILYGQRNVSYSMGNIRFFVGYRPGF
ncbi:MAG: DUF4421 domain-containing protein [Bacteroidota bacterium]|nr:DUF4421 domain-containing protein [Bacteroidota bacterium]MDX5430593.1 DUF4421 domain-containing protein [Bacteroidota bacterium]MDX5469345.1 DUF4421 domain-containing protein [Bacteroidota bacterium]